MLLLLLLLLLLRAGGGFWNRCSAATGTLPFPRARKVLGFFSSSVAALPVAVGVGRWVSEMANIMPVAGFGVTGTPT